MKKFKSIPFIKKLCTIAERQLEGERKALQMILEELDSREVEYSLQKYITQVPKFISKKLVVDGYSIEVEPAGLISGTIDNKLSIVSNLTSSQLFKEKANLNFSPVSKSISRSNHYFAPALAFAKSDLERICSARKVKGILEVEKQDFESINVLVGNVKNPEIIVFSHYDSISSGAVDNASGTALSLDLIFSNPGLLNKTLFVLCGNEELSYDKDVYWGHGYRVFEKMYKNILDKSRQIIVLDSFGFGKPIAYKDIETVTLGLPLKNIKKYITKTVMVSGELMELFKFYHTKDDVPERITLKYMNQAKKLFTALVNTNV